MQRNAKALTSFSRSAFPASSSSFWKSILGTKNMLGNGFTEATSYHCLPHFLLFIFHVSATLPQMFRLHLSVQTEEGNCPQKKKSHEKMKQTSWRAQATSHHVTTSISPLKARVKLRSKIVVITPSFTCPLPTS